MSKEMEERLDLEETIIDDCIEDMGGDTGEWTREEIGALIREISDAVIAEVNEAANRLWTKEEQEYYDKIGTRDNEWEFMDSIIHGGDE